MGNYRNILNSVAGVLSAASPTLSDGAGNSIEVKVEIPPRLHQVDNPKIVVHPVPADNERETEAKEFDLAMYGVMVSLACRVVDFTQKWEMLENWCTVQRLFNNKRPLANPAAAYVELQDPGEPYDYELLHENKLWIGHVMLRVNLGEDTS